MTKKENDAEHDTNDVYSFSYAFDYWDSYHRCNEFTGYDLYVSEKHTNLKDELINNEICCINIKQWNDVQNKAKIFLQSNHAKQKKCGDTRRCYVDHYSQKNKHFYKEAPLFLHNLCVLILYTDFDELSYQFSATYRHKNAKENLQQLIIRHANYYWMARYLRETIEGYGSLFKHTVKGYGKLDYESQIKTFYHGISQNMTFTSLIAPFHHPLSTTKQLTVAQIFATNNGMIISLEGNNIWGEIPFFECHWISAFANEDEYLFIGGSQPFKIVNIINCSTGHEYKKYLPAIRSFINVFDRGIPNDNTDELMKHIINRDNEIPFYVLDLFDSYTNYVKSISIYFESLKKSSYLSALFLTNTKCINKSFVNLKLIGSLFKNCKVIQLYHAHSKPFVISLEYISEISLALKVYQWKCLDRIEIHYVMMNETDLYKDNLSAVDTLINSSQKQFKETTKFNIRCKCTQIHMYEFGERKLCIERY
eukprot:18647_1